MNETIDQTPVGISSSVARWLRQNFAYRPLLLLFAIGAILRVILLLAYFPAVMMTFDAPRYARIDSMPMFGDFWMPAGYPMFLRLLHAISHQLWFTIAVQHAMGLSVGLMIFLVMRRLGAKPWIACLPSGVIFLSGDQLYLEHIVMADWFLIFLTAGGLAAAVRGLVPGLNPRWIALGSVFLATAALVRSVGIVLLPVLVVCTVAWVRQLPGRRTVALAAAVLPGMGVFGLYLAAFKICHGQYLGLSDMRGWNLYSRIAPFADCRKFDPPDGTEILCEERAPTDRPGPFGYVWDLNSVPRVNFELGPESGRKLGAFARQAILHQPEEYLRAILIDLAKYIDSSINPRPYSGQPHEILSFGFREMSEERLVVEAMSHRYRGTVVYIHGQRLLAHYQNIFRVSGISICAFALLAVLGMLKGNGSPRLGVFLFGFAAFALYLIPVSTISYDYRYGIPAGTLMVVSGLLGAASLCRQFRVTASEV